MDFVSGNSLDKLRHTRSVAYSVELVTTTVSSGVTHVRMLCSLLL